MSLDNILVTTPYVTHDKLNIVISELEKEWKEKEEDPSLVVKIINLEGKEFTSCTPVSVPGLYNKLTQSTKPVLLKNYKINGEAGPNIFSVVETTSYYDGTTLKKAAKVQSALGLFYVYESDNVVWITRWVKASNFIESIQMKENHPTGEPAGYNVPIYEMKLVWKTSIAAALKLLFTDLTISAIYAYTKPDGTYGQYVMTANTTATDAIYIYTMNTASDMTTWTDVNNYHLYAGMLSTL